MKPVSDRVAPQRHRSLPELPRTPWPAPLASRIGHDAGAAQIAAALDSLWREVDRVLSPIVGRRGVSALFERSLQVAHRTDPRLVALLDDGELPLDPTAFASLIASQTDADAARWGEAFLQAFHALLISLIGPSLTERLLHTAWGPPAPEAPAQGLH